jgi:hypothetical protein
LFASLVLLLAEAKKAENAMEDVALVASTQQNFSNLLFFRYLCPIPPPSNQYNNIEQNPNQ